MTKFNKLLSIFVIAGAVATGTAALVGCDGHIHSATKHEAVAATCTHAGTKEYYTCSGSECEGKYFSDEACTTEVTLESLTIAATGHTAVEHAATAATCTHTGNSLYYTCSGSECDGKYYTDAACTTETTLAAVTIAATGHTATPHEEHAATCTQAGNSAYYTCSGSECDGKYYSDEACTTETTLANTVIPALGHKDDNNDFRCDNNCGTNVFKAGHYYGVGYANMEIEVEENGTVWYKDAEYHIALSAEGVATLTLNVSSSGSSTTEEVTYTLTETAEGYKANHSSNVDIYLIEVPESKGVEIASFNGVFEGEYTYTVRGDGTYKITKLAITADGKVQRTQVKIKDENGDPIQNPMAVTDLLTDGAVTAKYNEFKAQNFHFIATEVEDGTYQGDSIKYVTELQVTKDGSVFANFTKTTETVKAVPTSLPLADFTYYEDANGFVRLVATASGTTKSYKINGESLTIINGDDTTREYLVYMYNSAADVAVNVTLEISADGNTIVATSSVGTPLTLTKGTQTFPNLVANGTTENDSAVPDVFNEEYAYYKVVDAGWYTFTAGSTAIKLYTEVDNHLVTNLDATVLNISSGESKTVQLEAGAYIAVDSSAATVAFTATYSATEPEMPTIKGTETSYTIVGFSSQTTTEVKAIASSAGTYYVRVDWTAVFDDNNKGAYFEINGTKYGWQYNGSTWSQATAGMYCELALAADDEVLIKVGCENKWLLLGNVTVYFETAAQYNARIAEETAAPTFSGDQLGSYQSGSDVYEVTANAITLNGTELTFVNKKIGVYNYTLGTATYTIVFNTNGTLSVTTNGYPSTMYKSVGVTFTEAEQGTYLYSYLEEEGTEDEYTVNVIYTVGANSVTVIGYYNLELICISNTNGVLYTFVNVDDGTTMTFSFENGNMVVTEDNIAGVTGGYTATKTPSLSFDADKQGTFLYTGNYSYEYVLSANSMTFSFGYNGYTYGVLTCTLISLDNGVYTFVCGGFEIQFSFIDSDNLNVTKSLYEDDAYTATRKPFSFIEDQQGTYEYTYEDITIQLIVSENTVTFSDGTNTAECTYVSLDKDVYTFEYATKATTYTLKFSFVNGDMYVTQDDFSGLDVPYTAAKPFVLSFTDAEQGTYEYTDDQGTVTFTIGENTVTFDDGSGNDTIDYTFATYDEGVYTFEYATKATTYTLKFSFVDGNMYVTQNDYGTVTGVYVKVTIVSVGENTIPNPDPDNIITGTAKFTAAEAGYYTFDFVNLYAGGTNTTVNGQTLTVGMDGTASITIALTEGQTIYIEVDQPMSGNVALTIIKGLVVGTNTISEFDSESYLAEVTFTATEEGTYTFDFTKVYETSTKSKIDGTALALDKYTGAASHTLTLTAGQTIRIVVEQNYDFDDITINITKA